MPRGAVDITARVAATALAAGVAASGDLNGIDQQGRVDVVHQDRSAVGTVIADGIGHLRAVRRNVNTVARAGRLLIEDGGTRRGVEHAQSAGAVVVAGAHGDGVAVGRDVDAVDVAARAGIHGAHGGPTGRLNEVGRAFAAHGHTRTVGRERHGGILAVVATGLDFPPNLTGLDTDEHDGAAVAVTTPAARVLIHHGETRAVGQEAHVREGTG